MVRSLAGGRLDSGQLAAFWSWGADLGFAECVACTPTPVVVG
jgi:hypothetical protein